MRECKNSGTSNCRLYAARSIVALEVAVVVCCFFALLVGCATQQHVKQDLVRLTYPNNFNADDMVPPRDWPESEKQQYCRGYVAGWKAFASRWRYSVGMSAKAENSWIQCRTDAGAFQQGFEMGQVEASRTADLLVVKKMEDIWDQQTGPVNQPGTRNNPLK